MPLQIINNLEANQTEDYLIIGKYWQSTSIEATQRLHR